MTQQIKEAALQWAEAVESRSPENVLKLYHEDGVLWGTLSPVTRHGYFPIKEYFEMFLANEDIRCTYLDGIVRVYGDFAFYSGSYEFTWKAGQEMVKVPARFSFIYKHENGKWLIMEHHSSLFPELPFDIGKYIQ